MIGVARITVVLNKRKQEERQKRKSPNTRVKSLTSSVPSQQPPGLRWLALWETTGAPNSSWWTGTSVGVSSGPYIRHLCVMASKVWSGMNQIKCGNVLFMEESVVLLLVFLLITQLCSLTSSQGIIFNLLLARSQGMFRMHLKKSTIKVFRGH